MAMLMAPGTGGARSFGTGTVPPSSFTHDHAAPWAVVSLFTNDVIAATAFVHLLSSLMLPELSSTMQIASGCGTLAVQWICCSIVCSTLMASGSITVVPHALSALSDASADGRLAASSPTKPFCPPSIAPGPWLSLPEDPDDPFAPAPPRPALESV